MKKTLNDARIERVAALEQRIQELLEEAEMLERADVTVVAPGVNPEKLARTVAAALCNAATKARNTAARLKSVRDDMQRRTAYPPEALMRAAEEAGFERRMWIEETYCIYCDKPAPLFAFERRQNGDVHVFDAWRCDACDVIGVELDADDVAAWIGDVVVEEERDED